ncbi:hypothetical protein EV702DRAFT_1201595 [Suillus placidus]|uniref:P-type phospholipid transporter n=1 Tax=Suillus placidus TaxID=48579 RepID=A0A9P6ZN92_9AGAM|nr:hypothetical protein EV702DRAFT_1201595 [Suillus placidus]
MGKEVYDDYKRNLCDGEANSQKYLIFVPSSDSGLHTRYVPSSSLKVGDLVVLEKNQHVPADMVLLRTRNASGTCCIRTDQLDGETHWKLCVAVPATQKLTDDRELLDLDAEIYANAPIKDIHTFIGTFTIHMPHAHSVDDVPMVQVFTVEPLSVENVLWSNAVLAAGSAVGFNTKFGLLDLEIDRIAQILCVVTLMLSLGLVALNGFRGQWYIYVFRFLILFSSIIPISLRVKLDMGKTVYAQQIMNDSEIPGTIVCMSTLPEELGHIEYLRNDWLEEETGNMAREGLRTLVVARKRLTSQQYAAFKTVHHAASIRLDGRGGAISVVAEHLEHDLELLGLTGVEDKLQDEVKGTLELFKNGGIKIWMLTGDKIETAQCIAISRKLVARNQYIHEVAKLKAFDQVREELDCCLVIDGESLQLCSNLYKNEFIEIPTKLSAVVACRCSPTQKADVARLIRYDTKKRVCCIGDGGNDVSMIQAADVGVGIVGKEGKQASFAADFSITQFSYLTKLLMWHGCNSYRRSAKLAQFVIHRGLIISIMQAVFSAIFYFALIALYQRWLMGRALSFKMFFQWLMISVYQASLSYRSISVRVAIVIHLKGYSSSLGDLDFVMSTRFAWKVAVIVAVSALPLYVIKLIRISIRLEQLHHYIECDIFSNHIFGRGVSGTHPIEPTSRITCPDDSYNDDPDKGELIRGQLRANPASSSPPLESENSHHFPPSPPGIHENQ